MDSTWRGSFGLVVRKLISFFVVMILVLTVEFLVFRVGLEPEAYLWGAPVDSEFPYTLPSELHFNESLVVQYFYYLADMLSGKGVFDTFSSTDFRDVGEITRDSFPLTLMLYGLSVILSMLFGFLAALLLSRSKSRYLKGASSAVLLSLWAVPVVFMAIFFLLQVVWRFSIDWGFGYSLDRDQMDWAERVFDDLKHRFFPSVIMVICSFGGFALIALQAMRVDQDGSKAAISGHQSQRRSFSTAIVSVMPCIKLNLALIMSFVLFIEVFWGLPGLGFSLNRAYSHGSIALVEASVWLMLLMVMLAGLLVDLSFSLLALRSSRISRSVNRLQTQQIDAPVPATEVRGRFLRRFIPDLRWFVSEFLKSTPGRVGGMLFIAMFVLALVGPMIAEPYDYMLHPGEADPVSQFLIGSRNPFLWTCGVLILTMLVGFGVGFMALPMGRFSYPVALVAECFLVFPIVGMMMMVYLADPRFSFYHLTWFFVLSTVLVTWAPVALIVLSQTKAVNESTKNELRSLTRIARYRAVLISGVRSPLPDAVSALKYSTVIGTLSILLFTYIFVDNYERATWAGMIAYSMNYQKIEEISLWWLLPTIGSILLISSLYLVLQAIQDILEKRIRLGPPTTPTPASAP